MKWKNIDPRDELQAGTRIVIATTQDSIFTVSMAILSNQPDGSVCIHHSVNDKMAAAKSWNENWHWIKAPEKFQTNNK